MGGTVAADPMSSPVAGVGYAPAGDGTAVGGGDAPAGGGDQVGMDTASVGPRSVPERATIVGHLPAVPGPADQTTMQSEPVDALPARPEPAASAVAHLGVMIAVAPVAIAADQGPGAPDVEPRRKKMRLAAKKGIRAQLTRETQEELEHILRIGRSSGQGPVEPEVSGPVPSALEVMEEEEQTVRPAEPDPTVLAVAEVDRYQWMLSKAYL